MDVITKAAGVVIKDKKLLLERSNDKTRYNSPGGKIEPGETPQQALIREVYEEFRLEIKETDLEFMGQFERNHDTKEDTYIVMYVFFVKNWVGEPKPSSEIKEIIWVDYDLSLSLPIGTVFQQDVIPYLHKSGYIC